MKANILLLIAMFAGSFAEAGNVEWIRTAQGTNDRLTPQPPLQFGGDFDYSTNITIDRYCTSGICDCEVMIQG